MASRARVRIGAAGKLPPEARIRHRIDFSRIQRHGLRAHAKAFTVIVDLSPDGVRARLGCAISRRVGNAVLRNRVRRLIRETFRRIRDQLPAVDVVVVAKQDAAVLAQDGLSAMSGDLLLGIERALVGLDQRGARGRSKRPGPRENQ